MHLIKKKKKLWINTFNKLVDKKSIIDPEIKFKKKNLEKTFNQVFKVIK